MKMTTLKGVFPEPPQRRKNFIHENVKNLRKMEQCFHLNKEVDEMQKSQFNKHGKATEKYGNVTPKVNTSFRAKKQDNNVDKTISNHETEKQPLRKISTPTMNKKNIKNIKKAVRPVIARPLNKQKKDENVKTVQPDLQINVSSDPNLAHKHVEEEKISSASKFKHQSIQTLDEKHFDKLYMEGVIRYPSKKGLKSDEQMNSGRLEFSQETKENNPVSPSDRGDTCVVDNLRSDELKESQSSSDMANFVKLNKERVSVATKLATQLNNGIPPPNYRKGVVPKYIRDKKEAQQKEEKNKAATFDPDCPEGHVPLPDHERKETLRMLKKNYQDYVNELNMMPIKADTLRVQKRKVEIEKQLNKLEEGIKVFSRPKVYVKVNA